jgi:isopentenyldiphosphate isomerase
MVKSDELLFVVDDDNNPIDPQPRSLVHKNGLWHRTAHIWIVNKKKEILCHRRSMTVEISPGNWDPYCGGHLGPNVSYIDGAIRELNEEMGITATEKELSFFKVYKNETNTEFQGIFFMTWEGDSNSLHMQKDEVEQIEWFPLADVWSFIVLEKKEGWSNIAYAENILEWLINLQK